MVNAFLSVGELATRLQEASVKLISRNICNKLYDDAVTPRMLCAGNLQGGVDACQVSACVKTEFSDVNVSPRGGTGRFLTTVNIFCLNASSRVTLGARWCVWSEAGGGSWPGS